MQQMSFLKVSVWIYKAYKIDKTLPRWIKKIRQRIRK